MRSPATPYLQVIKGSRDLLLEFWDLLHISGTGREEERGGVANGTEWGKGGKGGEKGQLGQGGDTSNLARTLTMKGTNKEDAKLGHGVWRKVT